MSEGLEVIGKVLEQQSRAAFHEIDADMLMDNESEVYNFVREHYREFRELPLVDTVEDETGIQIPPTEEALDFYKGRLEDRYLFNSFHPHMSAAREHMAEHSMVDMMTDLEAMLQLGRRVHTRNRLLLPREMNDIVFQKYAHTKQTGIVPGYTTGYREIDDHTMGHQDGDLNVLVSRMGMGKTYILLKDLLEIQDSGAVGLLVSMEMPLDQLGRRIHYMRTGINTKAILAGQLDWYQERALMESKEVVDSWRNIHLYNANMVGTVEDIEGMVSRVNPDIVLIDGLYLLKSRFLGNRNVDRNQNIAHVTDELKVMASNIDRPVFATTQFNRQAGKGGKFGSLENLGFTDTLAQHGSLVWALKSGDNPHQRIIEGLKAREGGTGSLRINYVFPPDGRKNFDAIEWFVPDTEEEEDRPRRRRRRSEPNMAYMNSGASR